MLLLWKTLAGFQEAFYFCLCLGLKKHIYQDYHRGRPCVISGRIVALTGKGFTLIKVIFLLCFVENAWISKFPFRYHVLDCLHVVVSKTWAWINGGQHSPDLCLRIFFWNVWMLKPGSSTKWLSHSIWIDAFHQSSHTGGIIRGDLQTRKYDLQVCLSLS